MHTYRWKNSPLVEKVEVTKRMDDYWATLRLAPNITDPAHSEILKDLPRALSRHGVGAYADVEDGQHVLRITNIDDMKELFSALRSANLITNKKPELTKTKFSLLKNDGKSPGSFLEMVKKYATRLRGIAGQLGDVFLLLHSLEERRLVKSGDLDKHVADGTVSKKDAGVIREGSTRNLKVLLAYGSQSAIHTFFGAGKSEVPFDNLMRKIKSRTYAQGGEFNRLAWIEPDQTYRKGGITRGLYRLFRENAATVSETIPFYGNWQKIQTGLGQGNKKNEKKKGSKVGDWGQFGTGVAQLLVNIIAAYVPEQTKESIEAEPNAPWFKKNRVYQWIAARPIKIQSWVTILDKIPQYISVKNSAPNLKKRRQYYFWEVTFYGLGRVFGALASKNSEKPNHLDAYTPAFAMAANLLVGLPQEKTENTIAIMAEEFSLAVQQQIGQKVAPEKIAKEISRKLDALQTSPFIMQQHTIAESTTPITNAALTEEKPVSITTPSTQTKKHTATPAWSIKTTAKEMLASSTEMPLANALRV